MFSSRLLRMAAAVLCVFSLAATVAAAEVDCDSIYCFSSGDFADGPEGICITALPLR